MKIEQQPLDTCELKLTIELDDAELEAAKRKAARTLLGNRAIPGFRKGKAPYEIILRHIGEGAVTESAMQDLAQESYRKAITELDLDVVGPGQLTDVQASPTVFTYTVPLRPEVELGDYRNVRLDYTEATVTEEALNRVLDRYREQEALLEPMEGEARLKDVVTVDVIGSLIPEPAESEAAASQPTAEAGSTPDLPAEDSEAQPAAEIDSTSDLPTEASEAQPAKPNEDFFLFDKDIDVLLDPQHEWPAPGFVEKLTGIRAEEVRRFELRFPDDYANESLRGRLAHYDVKCSGVKARTLPELNDDLAKAFEYESADEMRAGVREKLLARAKREVDEEYTNSVIDLVTAGATVKYPPFLLAQEVDRLLHEFEHTLQAQNLTLEDYQKVSGKTDEQLREELEPPARERLRRSLVVSKVAVAEGLTVSEEEVSVRIEATAQLLGKDGNEYRRQMNTEDGRLATHYDLLSKQAIQRLVAIARGENLPSGSPAPELGPEPALEAANVIEPEEKLETPEA